METKQNETPVWRMVLETSIKDLTNIKERLNGLELIPMMKAIRDGESVRIRGVLASVRDISQHLPQKVVQIVKMLNSEVVSIVYSHSYEGAMKDAKFIVCDIGALVEELSNVLNDSKRSADGQFIATMFSNETNEKTMTFETRTMVAHYRDELKRMCSHACADANEVYEIIGKIRDTCINLERCANKLPKHICLCINDCLYWGNQFKCSGGSIIRELSASNNIHSNAWSLINALDKLLA